MKAIKYIAAYMCLLFTLNACKTVQLNQQQQAIQPDSSKAVIHFQTKKSYRFNNGSIIFDNRFAAARLNSVIQKNDSTFTVTIQPENSPINPSPWYAFKIWSASSTNLNIILDYVGTTHRYDPKISYPSKKQQEIKEVKLTANKKQAQFRFLASTDTALIAAQEIINTADANKWMDSLASAAQVKKQVIGHSLLGKPIMALHTLGSNGKKLVVVLSRQHPPEVTGYMAMQEFVRTVTGNTTLAQNFRKQYELVLIPLINPDGVDEGNWRHSAAGVDLNRDWELFQQPETKSVQTYLLDKVSKQNAKVYFGIDFHSTYNDIFYTNEDQPLKQTNVPGFTNRWLDALKHAIPNFEPNIKPSPNGGNVSKSWMGRILNAEALTYEVGDNTARTDLQMKGRVAAEQMMELLLAAVN